MTRASDYNTYGNTTAQHAQLFIWKAYYAIMGRGADYGGFGFWVNPLIPLVTSGNTAGATAQKIETITQFVNAEQPALFSGDFATRRAALRAFYKRIMGYEPVNGTQDNTNVDLWANPSIPAAQVAAGILLQMIELPIKTDTVIPYVAGFVGNEFNNRVSFSIRCTENGFAECTAAMLAPINLNASSLNAAYAAYGLTP